MDKMKTPSYYAIIPATIRYDDRLKPNTKLLYGEVTALCSSKGFCWALNSYFASLYKVDKQTISRWIKQLRDYGYIKTEIIYKEQSKEIKFRYIYISDTPIDKKVDTPIDEIVKDSNTSSFSNTSKESKHIKTTKQVSLNTFQKVQKEFSKETRYFIEYFLYKYNQFWNWDHPFYSTELLFKCAESIETQRGAFSIDLEYWETIVLDYFENYVKRPDIDCRLAHFTHKPDNGLSEIEIFCERNK